MHDADARRASDLVRQGAELHERTQYDEAERCWLLALELEHDCAEAHLNLGLYYLGCGRTEDAVDYLQLAVHFAPRSVAGWQHLGSALAKLGRSEAAFAACRQATAMAPADRAAWMTLGGLHKARSEWEAAIDCYRAAVACAPTSAEALCVLGFALHKAGNYAESRIQFEAALRLSPDMVQAHHNLGLSLLETGQPDEALACFFRALDDGCTMIETRAGAAHALRDLGRFDEAIRRYDEVLAMEPDFSDAVLNRSYALLMKGNYVEGWTAYEQRLASGGEVGRDFKLPPWRGESLAGKRVLIYAEQGLGDEIMFASCLPDILPLARLCIIECNTRLASLFRRSFPAAHVHGGAKTNDASWLTGLPPIDYQIAIGSLPKYFRQSASDFPARRGYLAADAARVMHWKSQLAPAASLRVGIAWRGGTLKSRQFARSIPLALWAPLLRTQQVEFYALQYGNIIPELDDLHSQSGVTVVNFGSAVDDLEELAAIVGALDLVISVDTMASHLAGALGKPVWTLLPCSPEWRYPRQGEAMAWYPSMRLFLRTLDEGWQPVIARVAAELSNSMRSTAFK